MRNFVTVTISALVLAIVCPASEKALASDNQDRKQVETIVHDYLMENPAVVVKALDKYRQQQAKAEREEQSKNLSKHIEYLHSKDNPYAGNIDGDVTVVEFLDYNCGYCKRALNDILAVIEDDKNVRFVLMDLPILSEASKTAAAWALAAHKQGRYLDYHIALMKHSGPKNENILEKMAKKVGLDIEKMRRDAESAEINGEIEKIRKVAVDLRLSGTPAFAVGTHIAPGYMGPVELKEAIKKARENK